MKIQTDYKLVEYNSNLDLTTFYQEALNQGFENNSSQAKMIDCFKKERSFNAWILYKKDVACGAVVCHTLDIMGDNAYRICARTCVFPNYSFITGLYTKHNFINQHQHIAAQMYMPASIKWAGIDKDFYITTNDSEVASQRRVHRLWCPEMERMGMLEKVTEIEYRGHKQIFWKLNTQEFLNDLEKYPRWEFIY